LAPLKEAIRITEEGTNKIDETLQTIGLEVSPQEFKFYDLQPEQPRFYKNTKGDPGK
jgi:hypothetical protein